MSGRGHLGLGLEGDVLSEAYAGLKRWRRNRKGDSTVRDSTAGENLVSIPSAM